jgi:23S rRNA (guanine2445-N2)-methyltransferase / 23S rRNA (guanine2069-N7)-methyltransferase
MDEMDGIEEMDGMDGMDGTDGLERQAEMLVNRIRKNRRRLRPWLEAEGVTCFRLYDRDIPELPLVIDWYEGRLHVSFLPREGSDDGARAELVSRRVGATLGVPEDHVYVKRRARAPGGTQYERLGREGERLAVREGGHRFLVNLADYIDTGLFLDHRITRRLVAGEARGKRFLNLFAYTGAFTVYAAAAGALATTTVDLSQRYLAWAEDNLRLNGLAGPAHAFVRDDVIAALEEGRVSGEYDLVVLDPPTVSKSKRMKRPFDVQRDHARLLERVLGACAPGGVVYFSTNLHRFSLELAPGAAASIEDLTAATIPPDFRDPRAHRCFRIVKG